MTFKKTTQKAFCKVCHDAGKSEAEYTNHFVKSEPGPKGKVVCPTLLSLKCSYCQDNGHTVSYCIQLQQNKKNKEKNERAYVYQSASTKKEQFTEKKALANRFEALDEEELEEGEEKDEFPALCQPINEKKPLTSTDDSYAVMASKLPTLSEKLQDAIIVATVPIINSKPHMPMKCWADEELTDDEDDEIRSKYRRHTNTNINRIVLHDNDKYDDMSDNSYASYDDVEYYHDNDDNEYNTAQDAFNSISCANWKNFIVH